MAHESLLNPVWNSSIGLTWSQPMERNRRKMTYCGVSVLPTALMESTNLAIALNYPLTKDMQVLKSPWLHCTNPQNNIMTRQVIIRIPICVIRLNQINIRNLAGNILRRKRCLLQRSARPIMTHRQMKKTVSQVHNLIVLTNRNQCLVIC